jgi:hypothetical protein
VQDLGAAVPLCHEIRQGEPAGVFRRRLEVDIQFFGDLGEGQAGLGIEQIHYFNPAVVRKSAGRLLEAAKFFAIIALHGFAILIFLRT